MHIAKRTWQAGRGLFAFLNLTAAVYEKELAIPNIDRVADR